MAVLGRLADRMLGAVLPQADAGACPCGDSYCTYSGCPRGYKRTCRDNCNCTQTSCGPCSRGTC